MLTYINPNQLIHSKQFVLEPVSEVIKEIKNTTSNKVILKKEYGCGKTLILSYLENQSLGSENPSIYMSFDPAYSFGEEPNERFDEDFFKHYYELRLSWQLLYFMEENYTLTYNDKLKGIRHYLEDVSNKTDDFIRYNAYLDDKKLTHKIMPKEVSSQIISIMKESSMDDVSLSIDRFDSICGSSSYVQKILSDYFDLFSKVTLSINDDKENKVLENKGYSIVTPTYSSDVNAVKEIIKRRIEATKRDDISAWFNEDILSKSLYKKAISKTNGNIKIIMSALNELKNEFVWKQGKLLELEDTWCKLVDDEVDKFEKTKKMDAHPPKFYL